VLNVLMNFGDASGGKYTMGSTSVTIAYDDVPEFNRPTDSLPTALGLAACLESLEIDAALLGKKLVATLIGSARLALLDP
jgi:hypothetical protein